MEPTINKNILSVPPYISVNWSDVQSLRISKVSVEQQELVISLKNGETISIPSPSNDLLLKAFRFHADHHSSPTSTPVEKEPIKNNTTYNSFEQSLIGKSNLKEGEVRLGLGTLDGITAAMEHNPSQSNLPDLPPELLDKVAAVSRALTKENNLPTPDYVENCNCLHCQIAKSVERGIGLSEDYVDEEVSDEDLKFREWDIDQKDEHIYKVSNPLNKDEVYSVYIGDPLGCTCGQKDCEHIKAVLSS